MVVTWADKLVKLCYGFQSVQKKNQSNVCECENINNQEITCPLAQRLCCQVHIPGQTMNHSGLDMKHCVINLVTKETLSTEACAQLWRCKHACAAFI